MTDTEKNKDRDPGEAELMARIGQGDQRAFSEMVRRYWNRIYSHGLAYLKSTQRAEEATQDIFMKVWTTRDRLEQVRSLDNYLFIIARNHIFNEMRRKIDLVYGLASAADGQAGEHAETSSLPDLQTEYRESYQKLLKGIELLPEKRKVVFKLSRMEGLSNEQIAARLGIHKDTVYQYLVKSLLFLRTYMREHMGDTLLALLLLDEWRRIK